MLSSLSDSPPLKKSKMDENVTGALDAKALNKYSRQNAALGKTILYTRFQ